MEVLMNAHVDMFGVAAALWSLVGKLQTRSDGTPFLTKPGPKNPGQISRSRKL
jgi:hypothetical protein